MCVTATRAAFAYMLSPDHALVSVLQCRTIATPLVAAADDECVNSSINRYYIVIHIVFPLFLAM